MTNTFRGKMTFILSNITFCILLVFGSLSWADTTVDVDGELRKWHKLSLTFDGPKVSELDEDNPFLNYRLNVRFTHNNTGKSYLVPGYFAADGDAANTGAVSGNKWRVHFRADELGQWRWQAEFRKAYFVAVSDRYPSGFSAGYMDGQTGKFNIKKTNKKWPDFRQRGRLQYVHQPYLRFAETGEYFIKSGPDSPENLLSYADFDGTFKNDGRKDKFVKLWDAHNKDWQKGDPTWNDGKGKGLIGALNYISGKGMNSISFLTMNIVGDDENVFPYVDNETYDRFDVSKLAQWEVVFSHAQNLGLFLHFKTQEVENQGLLDNGGLGLERTLYYRELIARFGHHLALNWNMGEENGHWHPWNKNMPQTTNQRLSMARYFYEHDPYRHHIVIHNGINYDDLRGADSFYTGASLQTHREDFGSVHPEVKKLKSWPVTNGRPLAISVDEPGDAEHSLIPDSVDPEHNLARMNGLWGALTAGAWGTEWYFGYKHPHSDLTAEDWRTRDLFWDQAKHALDFFKMSNVDYHLGESHDELVTNAWVLAQRGAFYIVYVKDASLPLTLKLENNDAEFSVKWFNPRRGGEFQTGSIETLMTHEDQKKQYWERFEKDLGLPPAEKDKDWVVLVKKM